MSFIRLHIQNSSTFSAALKYRNILMLPVFEVSITYNGDFFIGKEHNWALEKLLPK